MSNLPASTDEFEQVRPTPTPPDRPARILIAEDEHLIATSLVSTMQSLGLVTVGPVSDGQAAVDLARTALPDLALLDIRMPKRDGLSAAKELFHSLRIPAIILTAFSNSDYLKNAQEAGVFGYLIKPVHAKQLRACIDVAWHQYIVFCNTEHENLKLKQRLEDRKVIEKAKWVLVKQRSIEEAEAMRLLQKQARDSQRTMATIAADILRTSGES